MDENEGFSVRDRRGSTDVQGEQLRKNEATKPDAAGKPDEGHLPEMDFSSFVVFLASMAQMNLGSIPHPETGETGVNTVGAKQMIDILDIMKNKTKGNLTDEEGALLDQVLFNLRMHYVRVVDEQKKSGGK